MKRKEFIRKGLQGLGLMALTPALPTPTQPATPDIIGFNHLPPQSSTTTMANTVLHKANTRGYADHGWLQSYHTFSFAGYYNPERMQFGALRVLNDDHVAAGMGFGTHPHNNMEIVSIPLKGDLEHKDSMGNIAVIKKGDIQVMSAGTGITHSEYNRHKDAEVKFLQIWVVPNKRNVAPRYDQITLQDTDRHNVLQQILSPSPDDAGVWIHQDAWFHLGTFDTGQETTYQLKKKTNGVYIFLLNGEARIAGQTVSKRDGFGIWDIDALSIEITAPDTEILLMEVPMNV